MTSYWQASVGLIDDNQKRTTLRLQIGNISGADFGTEAANAAGILSGLITDLKAITLANVEKISLATLDPNEEVDAGVPATGSDVSEELVLIVYTDDAEKIGEVDRLRVPSPVDSVWVNDNYEEGFDLADALAAAYVANFEDTYFQFSDGEHVDTTLGTAGIKAGFWRSRKMQVRPLV
jgi:hypothetical protein